MANVEHEHTLNVWLADLLRHGLLRPSFIPDWPQRELRELVCYRTSLVQERSHEINRLQQVLEGANIKLASVATDVLGVSGRAMLQSLAAGETSPQVLAALAKGRLRAKRAALVAALDGGVGAHQHFLLGMQLRRLQALETELGHLDAEVARRVRPHQAVLTAVAVAHSIAVILHHIIRTRQLYVDLGHHYFEQRDQAALTCRAVRQLERLGHTVTIQAT